MTTAPPQYSPDGRWWWDGTQWVPTQAYGYQPSPYSQPQPTDGKAIASLVCGIVWTWGPTSIAAIVLGHLSRREAKQQNRPPSGMALAGLILGYVGLAGAVLLVSLLFVGGGVHVQSVSGTAQVFPAQSIRAELVDLGKAEETYFTDNMTYTQDESLLSDYGWTGGDVLIASADETSYCLQGVDGTTPLYLSSNGKGVTTTPCT